MCWKLVLIRCFFGWHGFELPPCRRLSQIIKMSDHFIGNAYCSNNAAKCSRWSSFEHKSREVLPLYNITEMHNKLQNKCCEHSNVHCWQCWRPPHAELKVLQLGCCPFRRRDAGPCCRPESLECQKHLRWHDNPHLTLSSKEKSAPEFNNISAMLNRWSSPTTPAARCKAVDPPYKAPEKSINNSVGLTSSARYGFAPCRNNISTIDACPLNEAKCKAVNPPSFNVSRLRNHRQKINHLCFQVYVCAPSGRQQQGNNRHMTLHGGRH